MDQKVDANAVIRALQQEVSEKTLENAVLKAQLASQNKPEKGGKK